MPLIKDIPVWKAIMQSGTIAREWIRWFENIRGWINDSLFGIVGTPDNFVSISADNIMEDSGKAKPSGDVVGTTDTQTLTNKTMDGTDKVIVATGQEFKMGNSAGTNATIIEPDGTMRFDGDATVWEDLRVPAQNTRINPSKSEPAFEQFHIITGNLYVYKFDSSNADDESLHFIAQMPHAYKEGSDLYPHLHWAPDDVNTGNVFWTFTYTVADIDSVFPGDVSDTLLAAAGGTQRKHLVESFSAIDGTGLTISHILICSLTRNSSSEATDTYSGNACFLEFDFHYEVNSAGSRTEFVK